MKREVLKELPLSAAALTGGMLQEYQQLLVDTFRQNGTEFQPKCAEMEIECEKEMAAQGMTIHELDNTPFKEAVEKVYTDLNYSDLRDAILKEAGLAQ